MTQTKLDVRPVEPKDRFETIMGAYEGSRAGACSTSRSTTTPSACTTPCGHPRRGFVRLRVPERGPEVWRVEVLKR